MKLTLEQIARDTGGAQAGDRNPEVRGVSIDSRTIRRGELFVAIRGPRFDGHRFIEAAREKGAAAAVVALDAGVESSLPLVRVGCTLDALHRLAREVRRRWGGPIIGVTGSSGKTTTKEMVAAVLGRRYRVHRSTGNFNNEYGLPLQLLRLESFHDMAVIEMGMSAAGEILKLASIAEPNEGVVTNVSAAHLEFFPSVDAIAAAKAELLEGLVGERRAYLNNDDSRVRWMSRNFDGEIVTYGVRSVAAFHVTEIQHLGVDGTAFTMHHGRRDVNFVLPLLGAHNVVNAAAAIAVGATHGVEWDDMRLALEGMAPEKMRGHVVKFREGFALIDDSYNSNPKALSEMIRLLASVPGFDRRIVVAGDMLELGPDGGDLHAACGRDAVKAGIDLIVGVGPESARFVEGARDAGAVPESAVHLQDAVEAGDWLSRHARSGDLILLKGSRGMRLEQALDTLRLSFSSMEP